MAVDVILGLQWGDEGKGKIVDYLAPSYDIICRFQGGPNAGHTLHFDGKKFVLHTVPSGIFREGIANLIGPGVVIDPVTLARELSEITSTGTDPFQRLQVARKAHLILPTHRLLDQASELSKGKDKIGSTLRGIGPTYMDKTGRNGLRVGDLDSANFERKYRDLKEKHLGLLRIYPTFAYDLEETEQQWMASLDHLRKLKKVNSAYHLADFLKNDKRILAEGAQGSMLDINFGTYPYVTSSTTLTAGVCIGLGLPPQCIREVIGVTKAYCTRVGSGPFPTELHGEEGEFLRQAGGEFGATTGRPRRCGWIDVPQLQYTIMLNGVTKIALTKIDVLDELPQLKMGVSYLNAEGTASNRLPYDLTDDQCRPQYQSWAGWQSDLTGKRDYAGLPEEAQTYIEDLQKLLHVPIAYVSNGPERESLINRDELL